jgi:hypothetical protein
MAAERLYSSSIMRRRSLLLVVFGFYLGLGFIGVAWLGPRYFPFKSLEIFSTIGAVIIAASFLLSAANYLGIFERTSDGSERRSLEDIQRELSYALNRLETVGTKSVSQQVNVAVGDEIKAEIIQSLIATAKNSLS